MKRAQDYLAEANAVVPKITPEDAIIKHEAGNSLFIDVRASKAIDESGTIAGAVRIDRGFIEFAADGQPSRPSNPPDQYPRKHLKAVLEREPNTDSQALET